MLKINIIAIGNLKEKYLKDASAEYEKRLSAFCKLKITELDPARLPDSPNDAEINSALVTEAERITAQIPKDAFVVPMCIEGEQFKSEALAEKIANVGVRGISTVCFIIGGSYGLHDNVKRLASLKLSMSKMTFPHKLARIMLLEQIYRSFKILQGGTYHK